MRSVALFYDSEKTKGLAQKVWDIMLKQLPKDIILKSPVSINSSYPEEQVGAVFFVGQTGPSKSILEKMHATRINLWFIMIASDNNVDDFTETIKENWTLYTHSLNTLIAGEAEFPSLEKWLYALPKSLEPICLVASARKQTGKSSFIQLITPLMQKFKIVECPADDLEQYNKYANHAMIICLIGENENDFQMPVPSDGSKRCIFVLNKTDMNLFQKIYPIKSERLLSGNLLKAGWEKPPKGRYCIFPVSCCYKKKYQELKNNIITLKDLVEDPEFALWDEMFLTIPKPPHIDRFESFLSENNGFESLEGFLSGVS